jgi:hypothetical protein
MLLLLFLLLLPLHILDHRESSQVSPNWGKDDDAGSRVEPILGDLFFCKLAASPSLLSFFLLCSARQEQATVKTTRASLI